MPERGQHRVALWPLWFMLVTFSIVSADPRQPRYFDEGGQNSVSHNLTPGGSVQMWLEAYDQNKTRRKAGSFLLQNQFKKGACGKRQLRGSYRTEVSKILMQKTSERFRLEQAQKLLKPNDPEPPTLPNSTVLHVAKHQYIESLYLDPNPIVALAKIKYLGKSEEKIAIRRISYEPFFIIYWTNYQSLVYKKYAQKEVASLKIDASGNIVPKITKSDGNNGPHIFLYLAVVNFVAGQFLVTQMLSEAHDTGTILHWLTEWICSGVPPPKETVCDSARALLTAIVRAFTRYFTIEQYCNAFFSKDLPKTYVRIDVAHFIKIYANLLKNTHRMVKKNYMGVIGIIILSRDLVEARRNIKAALIVSKSETDGNSLGKKCNTPCSVNKEYLLRTITGQSMVNEIVEHVTKQLEEEDEDDSVSNERHIWEDDIQGNSWKNWCDELNEEVNSQTEDGNDVNAYFCPVFLKHLLKDCIHLPMWSCIFRDKFGFGRVPASSSSAEGEFNKIKNVFYKGELIKIRVDRFVSGHIELLDGTTNLAQANMKEINKNDDKDFEFLADEENDFDSSYIRNNFEEIEKNEVSKDRQIMENDANHVNKSNNKVGYENDLRHEIENKKRVSIEEDDENEDKHSAIEDEKKYSKAKSKTRNLKRLRTSYIPDKDQECSNSGNKTKIENMRPMCHVQQNKQENGDTNIFFLNQKEDLTNDEQVCTICDKVINASKVLQLFDDAEYEEKICEDCKDSEAVQVISSTRYEENWKGLTTKTKKSRFRASKYLNNEQHLHDSTNFPKNVTFPIMKNGLSGCGALTKRNKTLCVSNTCAFDSIIQIILLALSEHQHLQAITQETANPFLQLVKKICCQGLIGPHLYHERTKLLYEYLGDEKPRLKTTNDCTTLDCAINITYAVLHTFRNDRSCVEISKCIGGCTSVTKKRTTITLEFRALFSEDFNIVVKNKLSLPERPCTTCTSMIQTTLLETGTFMFFEVEDADLEPRVQLINIPDSYKVDLLDSEILYKLAGIVHYRPPARATRRSTNKKQFLGEGHYTAICPRKNGKWSEFDDTVIKEIRKNELFPSCPSLLVYRKYLTEI